MVGAYADLCAALVADAEARGEIRSSVDTQAVVDMLAGAITGVTALLATQPRGQHASIVRCAKLLFSGQLFDAR
jgi:hypothetical protein